MITPLSTNSGKATAEALWHFRVLQGSYRLRDCTYNKCDISLLDTVINLHDCLLRGTVASKGFADAGGTSEFKTRAKGRGSCLCSPEIRICIPPW
jgi:hypothetical protein